MLKCSALLVVACALGSARQEPAAPSQGSIAGVVVSGKTGAPLRKASITLTPDGTIGRGSSTVKTMETDQQGHFLFRSLEAGKYRWSASHQGFLSANYGARKAGFPGTPVIVDEGQDVKDLSLSLMPQSVITGKVLDEDGDPVPNVTVRALRNIYRSGKREWFPGSATNANDIGEYRLANLEPGRYLIETVGRNPGGDVLLATGTSPEPQPGSPERLYASTFYPSTLSSLVAIPVVVSAGDELHGMDVRLVRTSVFHVRGRVVGYEDSPAVSVLLAPANNRMGMQFPGMTQGADFEFEIRHVLPGEYTATAQSRTGTQFWTTADPIVVTGADVDGVRLNPLEPATIQGEVNVVDAATPPALKGLAVRLLNAGAGLPDSAAVVRDDHQFTLANVFPVRQTVSVTGVPENCYVQSLRYGGVEIQPDAAELHGGSTLQVTISCEAAQLDAVATTQDEKVAPNAIIALVAKGGATVIVATTDENGIFSFQGLKPGDYQVFAWEDAEEGAPLDPEFRKPFEGQAKTITLEPSAHANISLKAFATK